MGASYGRDIRQSLATNQKAVGVVRSVKDLPSKQGGTLVVGGQLSLEDLTILKSSLSSWSQLIFLNPAFVPVDLGLSRNTDKNMACKLDVFFGAYSQSPAMPAWNALLSVQQIDGAGNFIAGWADLIFREKP